MDKNLKEMQELYEVLFNQVEESIKDGSLVIKKRASVVGVSAADKKAFKDAHNEEKNSPFAVVNYINKNLNTRLKTGVTIKQVFNGIKGEKFALTDLLQVRDRYGKVSMYVLKRVNFPEVIKKASKEERQIYIDTYKGVFNWVVLGNNVYRLVKAKLTVNAFIDSYNAARKVDAYYNKVYANMIAQKESEREKEDKKRKSKEEKERAKTEKAIKKLALELVTLECYKDLSFSKVLEIARKEVEAA